MPLAINKASARGRLPNAPNTLGIRGIFKVSKVGLFQAFFYATFWAKISSKNRRRATEIRRTQFCDYQTFRILWDVGESLRFPKPECSKPYSTLLSEPRSVVRIDAGQRSLERPNFVTGLSILQNYHCRSISTNLLAILAVGRFDNVMDDNLQTTHKNVILFHYDL